MNFAEAIDERLTRSDDEREYYSLNERVWPVVAPFLFRRWGWMAP